MEIQKSGENTAENQTQNEERSEAKKSFRKDDRARCWFLTVNNPEKEDDCIGKSPSEVVDTMMARWMKEPKFIKSKGDDKAAINRGCGCCYEIGEEGTPHIHIVLCSTSGVRFSKIKELYPRADIEKGRASTAAIRAYLEKTGKHKEKGTTQVIPARYEGYFNNADFAQKVYKSLDKLLDEGYSPKEIVELSTEYGSQNAALLATYGARREKEIADKREVSVFWHLGESGSGKSYTYWREIERSGSENVFLIKGDKRHPFDDYNYERILYIDELRATDFSWNYLLDLLDIYPLRLACRYYNKRAAWETVHITSIIPPDVLYFNVKKDAAEAVQEEQKKKQIDSFQQLRRRITGIIYHYIDPFKDGNERYQWFSIPSEAYGGIAELKLISEKRIATSKKQAEEQARAEQLPLSYTTEDIETFRRENAAEVAAAALLDDLPF